MRKGEGGGVKGRGGDGVRKGEGAKLRKGGSERSGGGGKTLYSFAFNSSPMIARME